MNKENIQKGIDYLEANYADISKRFNMGYFRAEGFDMLDFRGKGELNISPVCVGVGCLAGHLTAIDTEGFYKYVDDLPCFIRWSFNFFDVTPDAWNFLFDSFWGEFPETNTLQQGINRMKYMLEHEQPPKDWAYGEY